MSSSLALRLSAERTFLAVFEETRVTVTTEDLWKALGVSPRVIEDGKDVGAFPPFGESGETTAMISFVLPGVYELRARCACGGESNSVTLTVGGGWKSQ